MSEARQCDRCGKFFPFSRPKDVPGTKTGPKYSINKACNTSNLLGPKFVQIDLCPTCREFFERWMSMSEEDRDGQVPTYLQWPEPRGGHP